MKSVLLHPSYFGPISQWVAMVQAEKIVFENEDNYQKQTYRNRMYIYDANGKLLLNIPIKHSASLGKKTGVKQKYKELQIENDFPWQQQHFRAFQASYQTSPFFEFYEDDLQPLYEKKFKYLLDFNYHCMEFAAQCLQLDWRFQKTEEFILEPKNHQDMRSLVNAKSAFKLNNTVYTQVFQEKAGFLKDLSILDLIFNEGNAALSYLQEQSL